MSDGASSDRALAEEEEARAFLYALLGRLLYAPPDAALLQQIAAAGGAADRAPLTQAWGDLRETSRSMDAETVRAEYDGLFIGAGKSPVTLYTASYAAPNSADRHLLALRRRLAGWRLERVGSAAETEDHIAGLCDAMRWLITERVGAEAERGLFDDFVMPAVGPLCDAILAAADARFYRTVAQLLRAFCEVESRGFELSTAADREDA